MILNRNAFLDNHRKLCLVGAYLTVILLLGNSCEKDDLQYFDDVREIKITDKIIINNGVSMDDPIFNYKTFEDFIKHIATSDYFMVVPQKDFAKTTSPDKVIISMRYDIDVNINAAVKFAYRENKYGIHSTYFFLHTSEYYGKTEKSNFTRNPDIIYYLKKIQDAFGHELGFHNDLITLQVVYDISPSVFLRDELTWLRNNGISVFGTCAHGSPFCYTYNYTNSYFWKSFPNEGGTFGNHNYVQLKDKTVYYEKDDPSNYNLTYNADILPRDYFFSDVHPKPGRNRWNMNMVNFDTIKPGSKVIILLHPSIWD
jgi:hypothetical protein